MSWSTQFGPEFAVPSEFTQNSNLVDISWGNDAAPSFTTKRLHAFWDSNDRNVKGWDYLPCIFVHPEKAEDREFPEGKRFFVMAQDGGNICETDDASEAIQRLVEHSNTQLLEFTQPETPEPPKQKTTLETLKDLLVESGVVCRWDDGRTIFIPLDTEYPDGLRRHLEVVTTSGPVYWLNFYYGKNLQGRIIGQPDATAKELLSEVYYSALTDYSVRLPKIDLPSNPRFVFTVGHIDERFPDVPDEFVGTTTIYDRQEKKAVATIHPIYSQLICLESATNPVIQNLVDWLNGLSNTALESEHIPATKGEYRA